MNTLNAKQLAFILGIEVQDAREKIVYAYCKSTGQSVPAKRNKLHGEDIKYTDYPTDVPIEVLSVHLNLPTLQESVNDIEQNYLTRPGSRKWILCDYPEKKIKSLTTSEGRKKLSLPGALKSLLPDSVQKTIHDEWRRRFPKYTI